MVLETCSVKRGTSKRGKIRTKIRWTDETIEIWVVGYIGSMDNEKPKDLGLFRTHWFYWEERKILEN